MATADREYNTDTFLGNLDALNGLGRSQATLPEITGEAHPEPAGGHPIFNIEGLQKRILEAPPEVTIPLTDDATIAIQKLPGGGKIALTYTF